MQRKSQKQGQTDKTQTMAEESAMFVFGQRHMWLAMILLGSVFLPGVSSQVRGFLFSVHTGSQSNCGAQLLLLYWQQLPETVARN
jgi:hypothetical protein